MGRRVMAGMVLLAGAAAAGAAVLQATGLVGQYELDSAAPGDDISVSNLDGTLSGSPTTSTDVPAPIAAFSTDSLDVGPGEQYVTLPISAPLSTLQQGSYTVMAWFKAAAMLHAAPDDKFGLVMKAGWNEGLYWDNGHFAMEHWTTNSTGSPAVEGVYASTAGTWLTTHSTGQWYHVAGVVDATARTTTVYVHTAGSGSAPTTATTPWNANPLVAGSWSGHAGIAWTIGTASPGSGTVRWQADGLVDDVRFYNSALTGAQITAIAQGADLGAATPTVVTPPTPSPPPTPRTEGNEEGLIGDRCACGSTASGPAPLWAAALAVVLLALLLMK